MDSTFLDSAGYLGSINIDFARRCSFLLGWTSVCKGAFRIVCRYRILGLSVGSSWIATVAQGSGSQLRFFEYTNSSEAVGFFANRNHFAVLLYVTILLASPWLVRATRGAVQKGALRTSSILIFVSACAMIIAITAGLAMARSRAGVTLAILALLGVAAISVSVRERGDTKLKGFRSPQLVVFALLLFSVLFSAQLGLHRILARFDGDLLENLRFALMSVSLEAAMTSLPFGTGLGSFVPTYAVFERAEDLFTGFANRAHNDFMELFLELGLAGILVVTLFLTWYGIRCFEVWFKPQEVGTANLILQRASTVCVALILLHSMVDYPLRTTAIAVVFAYCCGVLLPSRSHPKMSTKWPEPGVVPTAARSQSLESSAVDKRSQPADKVLGMQWPEQWRR